MEWFSSACRTSCKLIGKTGKKKESLALTENLLYILHRLINATRETSTSMGRKDDGGLFGDR